MRIEKRSVSAISGGGLQMENTRIEEDRDKRHFDGSDIDWDQTKNNIFLIGVDSHHAHWLKDAYKMIDEAGCRRKKDSVVLLDGLYTASPEFWKDKVYTDEEGNRHLTDEGKKYFDDCLAEHVKLYCQGDGSKVISAVIHLDEKTPHMHIQSVPLVEDEKGMHLSAKIIMGNRTEYRAKQDRFFEDVSKNYGLERGDISERSEVKKEHLTVTELKQKTAEKELFQARVKKNQAVKDARQAERDAQNAREDAQRTQERTLKLKAENNTLEAKKDALDARIDSKKANLSRLNESESHAKEQRLDALRQRDAARADFDVTKRLQELSDDMKAAAPPDVEVLRETEAKTSILGKEIPATVTIRRDDFENLCEKAGQIDLMRMLVKKLESLLESIKKLAQHAFTNKIDARKILTSYEVLKEADRADEAERRADEAEHLSKKYYQKSKSKDAKINNLTAELKQTRADIKDAAELRQLFPQEFEYIDKHKRAKAAEYAYDHMKYDTWGQPYCKFEGKDVNVEWMLKQYRDECCKNGITPRQDMTDHLSRMEEDIDLSR